VLFREEILLALTKTPREVEYRGFKFGEALIQQGIARIVNRLEENY